MCSSDLAERLDRLVKSALKAGADAADAIEFKNISVGVSYRLGKLEDVGRSESSDLGLRVFVGRQVAFVSSTDFTDKALAALPERAVAMARLAPEDKFAGLAPKDRPATSVPDVEIDDPKEPSTALLVERAHAAEQAALEVPGVTNSEGGSADFGRTMVTLATSEGFLGGYCATSRSVAVSVIAGDGTEMERDYDYSQTRFDGDLEASAAIGKRAGAWNLAPNSPEATHGVLLNHVISELLPERDGYRYANSDPVTGQAAWFDLRVRMEKCAPLEARKTAPSFPAVTPPAGLPSRPDILRYGADLK